MCENCEWEELVDLLDELLTDDRYEFADETLDGILSWVTKNEHATTAQWDAVENIKNSK